MRRIPRRTLPGVDVAEPRVLLSSAATMAGHHGLSGVVREVKAIMGALARNDDTARAGEHLTTLSARVPPGPQPLAPIWRADLSLYDPHRPGSVRAVQRKVLGDLRRYVAGGSGAASGTGSTSPPLVPVTSNTTPAPAASLDSVSIRNTTGLALKVTIYLDVPQVQKPWITRTIPAGGTTTVPFDFGTATQAFMTMNVGRADGIQAPPPLSNLSLSQPMGGYNGTLFTVSVFGSYFNVTPG